MSNKFLKQAWADANKDLTGFHVHIYFDQGHYSDAIAQTVTDQMTALFPQYIKDTARIGRVGPHTKPNIAIEITKDALIDIVPWLQFNNFGLSILIHPETGDDKRDHENAALWLNEPVAFNQKFMAGLQLKDTQIPKP